VAWSTYSYVLMQTRMFDDIHFIRQPCNPFGASLLIGSAGDARNFRPHHHFSPPGAEACSVRTYIKGLLLYLRSFPKATQSVLHLHLPFQPYSTLAHAIVPITETHLTLPCSLRSSIPSLPSSHTQLIAHPPPRAHLPSTIPLQAQILQTIAVLLG
jgi:hypothetical protein